MSSPTRRRAVSGSCQTAAAARTLPCEWPEMMSRPLVVAVHAHILDARSGTARSA
ncbi:hypothetical protein SBADM41S_06602 [Streptomyces badius]